MLTLEELQELLQDKNLSFIGKKVGITRAYLSQIRNGNSVPSYKTLVKLNNYFKKTGEV